MYTSEEYQAYIDLFKNDLKLHGLTTGQTVETSLQYKWRTNATDYPHNGTNEEKQKWSIECTYAIIDALLNEGIIAWDGDGVACVQQIIQYFACKR